MGVLNNKTNNNLNNRSEKAPTAHGRKYCNPFYNRIETEKWKCVKECIILKARPIITVNNFTILTNGNIGLAQLTVLTVFAMHPISKFLARV